MSKNSDERWVCQRNPEGVHEFVLTFPDHGEHKETPQEFYENRELESVGKTGLSVIWLSYRHYVCTMCGKREWGRKDHLSEELSNIIKK